MGFFVCVFASGQTDACVNIRVSLCTSMRAYTQISCEYLYV